MPLNDPVPSSAFDVLQRNAEDLDKYLNQDTGSFQNRTGDVLTPIPIVVGQVDAAKTQAIADIGADVGDVESAKTSALSNISQYVAQVDTVRGTAISTINGYSTAVNDAHVIALSSINDDVTTVDSAKNTAVNATIPGIVATVQSDANAAIGTEIPAIVQQVDDAATQAVEFIAAYTVYFDEPSGTAGTVNGEYFWVVSNDELRLLDLYLRGVSSSTFTGKTFWANLPESQLKQTDTLISKSLKIQSTGDAVGNSSVDKVSAGQFSVAPAVNILRSSFELGTMSASTGGDVESASYMRTFDFTPVNPSTQFYLENSSNYRMRAFYYNANFGFISAETPTNDGLFVYTTPALTAYVKFATYASAGHNNLNATVMMAYGSAPYLLETHKPSVTLSRVKLDGRGNLFDNAIENGTIATATGVNVAGALPTDFSRARNLLGCKPGTKYNLKNSRGYTLRMFFYDANGAFLNYINAAETFYTPDNCYFMRWGTSGTASNDLENRVYITESAIIGSWSFLDVSNVVLENGTISTSTGQDTAGSLPTDFLRTATYIRVDGDTRLITDINRDYDLRTFYYDVNKALISFSANSRNLRTPSNCYYIRFATYNSTTANDITAIVAVWAFEEFATKADQFLANRAKKAAINYSANKRFIDKRMVTFGDSITAYDLTEFAATHEESFMLCRGYQSYVRDELGCYIVNQGQGSKTMPEIKDIIVAYASFASAHFVTITSGANDARIGVLPGSVAPIGSVFDVATYAGALQFAIEHILATNSTINIYLMTPVNGFFNESGTGQVPGPYGGIDYISNEYADVMIEIGKLYGLPVCDWYYKSGVNSLNKTVWLGDKAGNPYYLHPKQIGMKRMGEMLVSTMIS